MVCWEHLVLARHWRETDVLFCPSYTVPLHYRGKLVVATHSVNEAEPGTHPWWYHLTYRQRNKLCARRSDAVIVPSQTTKKHVEDLTASHPRRSRSCPKELRGRSGGSTRVCWRRRGCATSARTSLCPLRRQAVARRNIPALIEAFAREASERLPHKLLLFGPNVLEIPLDELVERLGIAGSVVQTDGRIERHDEILPVYSGADLFVHPTAAEGFR